MVELRDVSKMLDGPLARVRTMVSRAVLRLVAEAAGVQLVQVQDRGGTPIDGAEHLQAYGFASSPLSGAEAIVLAVGSSRSHPVVIVIADRRYRPPLEPGEAILHDDQGQLVHIHRDGVLVKAAGKTVRIEAGEIELAATDRIKLDVAGRGFTYKPTQTEAWTTGSAADSAHPISPPEHP